MSFVELWDRMSGAWCRARGSVLERPLDIDG